MKSLLGVLVVLVGLVWCGLASSISPPPSPPALTDTFSDPHVQYFSDVFLVNVTASFNQLQNETTGEVFVYISATGTFYYMPLNETQLTNRLNASETFDILDGICRLQVFQRSSIVLPSFTLIAYANYSGLANVSQISQGRTVECQVWTWNNSVIYYVDNSSPMTLIRMELANITVDFSPEFQLNPPGLTTSSPLFDTPDICLSYHKCPLGPVIPIEVYNFHNVSYFWLNNTNTADVLGDTSFFCKAILMDRFTYFAWISQWQVMVNSTWGQYTFCNFGECLGGDLELVGREAPDGLYPDAGGQCVENSGKGAWYSFPAATECLESQTVGDNGCTWKVLSLEKTINASCLSDSSLFFDTCAAEFVTGNLTKTAQLFSQAFLSDDPANGGCPPIDIYAENPNGQGSGSGSSSGSVSRHTNGAKYVYDSSSPVLGRHSFFEFLDGEIQRILQQANAN